MHPRIIDAKSPGCPWPMCDVTTGRRDGDLIHFGEMAPVVSSAPAKDPACLLKVTKVEAAARNKLGMVSEKQYRVATDEIEKLRTENEDLRERLDAKESQLVAFEERARERDTDQALQEV
jgi:hypothetical protein